MHKNGWGVAQDDAEAARWYRLAAEQGDADAQFNLGLMYADGERWVNMTVEQGRVSVQTYSEDRGVPRDDGEARDGSGWPPSRILPPHSSILG